MNLQQLYYFHRIYKLKNYTQASKELLIAQSSLSHSISDLEKELGVTLFYKKGRNIVTTPQADRFYAHVDLVIRELETAKRELSEEVDLKRGTVHIAASYTLTQNFLSKMIREFCQIPGNEKVRFEWTEMTAALVNQALLEQKIDLGFGARIDNDRLVFARISSDEVSLIVPPNHPLAGRDEVPYSALNGEYLITFPYSCGTRYYIDDLLEKKHVTPENIQEANTENTIAGLVSAGRGIAIIPVLPELARYNVAVVKLEGEKLYRPMYMIWEKNAAMRPVVKKFRDFVLRKVGEEG